MTWAADPVRDLIVATVAGATVEGSPGFVEWDRAEDLGRQAWRRFSVLTSNGGLPSLKDAPAIGSGGLIYLNRTYLVEVFYERGRYQRSIGKDSDVMTDDAERLIAALVRMNYDEPNTGLLSLLPAAWRITQLPTAAYSVEIELSAKVRRGL
jgi:hypothetical protein